MLKIRRPLGRLIFNMGIAIPGKTVFLIETAPCPSVYLFVCLWHLFHNFPAIVSSWNFQDRSDAHAKVHGQRYPILFRGHLSSNFEVTRAEKSKILTRIVRFTDGYEMMHKAWSGIEEVHYWFSRSPIRFRGHMGRKIDDSDPNCAFHRWLWNNAQAWSGVF